jgi:hypothetical protein
MPADHTALAQTIQTYRDLHDECDRIIDILRDYLQTHAQLYTKGGWHTGNRRAFQHDNFDSIEELHLCQACEEREGDDASDDCSCSLALNMKDDEGHSTWMHEYLPARLLNAERGEIEAWAAERWASDIKAKTDEMARRAAEQNAAELAQLAELQRKHGRA